MTITVPMRLRKREMAAPVEAFLLRAPDRLADAARQLGPTPPAIHRVAGGFVLIPREAGVSRVPGAIALRRLAGDLFIPADADLVPALLPDESAALTRDAGLVILPGGTALAFDLNPLAPRDWLTLPTVTRGNWRALHTPDPLADRLTVIEQPAQSIVVEEMLAAGGPDDPDPLGESAIPDDARPPSGSPLNRAIAGAGLAAGKLLASLGQAFGLGGVARAGANLIRNAVERVPRVSEQLMGAQEAALRELLRQLQSGDVEKALRRAPIAVADPSAKSTIASGSQLATRDTNYSLRSLLGGGGVAAAWLGGGDVWVDLASQYRKLAEQAIARGDYRRAAYLHGVLLRDLRTSAAVLMRGGLFRDAAILYRDKLNDTAAAARAFEQASDYDEAVRLYIKAELDIDAGDLLRKLGLYEPARVRFAFAATKLIDAQKWVAAGDLIRARFDDESAETWYRRGWELGAAESIACGERLLEVYVQAKDWPATRSLFLEARQTLARRHAEDAGRFFNAARARLAAMPRELREDLEDAARLTFADHLRAGNSATARALFGGWAGPVARDAVYATRKPTPRLEPTTTPTIPLAAGTVTAVAVARQSGEIVVATTNQVVLWRPATDRILRITDTGTRRCVGVAIEPAGGRVYLLQTVNDDLVLSRYGVDGDQVDYLGQRRFHGGATHNYWLGPASEEGGGNIVFDVSGQRLILGRDLIAYPASGPAEPIEPGVLRAETGSGWIWDWNGGRFTATHVSGRTLGWSTMPWTPAVPDNSPLESPLPDWRSPGGDHLEVTGVDHQGTLYCGRYVADRDCKYEIAALAGPFRAACFTGAGRIAAVDANNCIHWLRATGGKLIEAATPKPLHVPAAAVAIVCRADRPDVIVLFADGSAAK